MSSKDTMTSLGPEAKSKLEKLLKDMRKELGMVMVKSFLMSAASVLPIVLISAMMGLLLTAFPILAGFATGMLIQIRYVMPRSKKIGEGYAKQIKEVLKEERRRQAQEG